ncbi:MAG TPA: nucleoside monophosphate kinase [Gemmataceae bacterium]|nr:nucleoside monophosphate kinase [Gemmataceae bacterium]
MRLVLVGPPGSGKGTQARLLHERLGLPVFGTGDMIRDAIRRGMALGKQAEPYIAKGLLVPDQLVNELVADLFRGPHPPDQFVFDGYPRTLDQARWFDQFLAARRLPLSAAIQFAICDDEVVRRLSGRRVSPTTGAVYHVTDRPPKVPGVCDLDGTPLVQREDDREEVIRERLRGFHQNTDKLAAYYGDKGLLKVVPAVGPIDSIYLKMANQLTGRA